MIEKIKKEWLKRLRSKEIKQGRGVLKNCDGAMCCLGVLCEMAVEEGVIKSRYDPNKDYDHIYRKKFILGWRRIKRLEAKVVTVTT